MKFKAKKGTRVYSEPNVIKFIDEIHETTNPDEIKALQNALDVTCIDEDNSSSNFSQASEPTKAELKEQLMQLGYEEERDYEKNLKRDDLLKKLEEAKAKSGNDSQDMASGGDKK